jgi:hypothetical protein
MMIYTRLLKIAFKAYEDTLNPHDYESFVDFVNTMMATMIKDLKNYSPGQERARRLQELVDIEIAQHSHIKASCHKGCSACCHLEVEITSDEASLLAEAIADGVVIDSKQLELLAMRERNDEKWKGGVIPANKCVFLDGKGSCSAYSYRPSACRKAAVTSPATDCGIVGAIIAPIYLPKVEVIISAALNLPESTFGSFAKMLLEKTDHLNTLISSEMHVT